MVVVASAVVVVVAATVAPRAVHLQLQRTGPAFRHGGAVYLTARAGEIGGRAAARVAADAGERAAPVAVITRGVYLMHLLP